MLASPNAASASERAVRTAAETSSAAFDDAHALSAAACHCFYDDGVADFVGDAQDLVVGDADIQRPFRAGHDRHAGADRGAASGRLAAHQRDRLGRGSDERQARVTARAGEGGVLGEEPVAGMHRGGAGAARRVDNRVDSQVAACRLAGPDMDGLIRLANVARVTIAVGVDGDRRDRHLAARASDAHSDLAAVGNQDFHRSQILRGRSVRLLIVTEAGIWACAGQSGMLPCFFGGLRSRLVWRVASASISLARVCRGRITSSTNPREAAT